MATTNMYLVTARRWGERETHSYCVGIYTKKAKAIKMADGEAEYRGGKYAGVVEEVPVDNTDKDLQYKEIYKSKCVTRK